MSSVDIFRWREWTKPVPPVTREVLTSQPVDDAEPGRPPLLFVAGYAHGAWAFAEKWLEHAASRGFPAYAMSLRGHGTSGSAPKTTLRAYTHDVVQVAARLPRLRALDEPTTAESATTESTTTEAATDKQATTDKEATHAPQPA